MRSPWRAILLGSASSSCQQFPSLGVNYRTGPYRQEWNLFEVEAVRAQRDESEYLNSIPPVLESDCKGRMEQEIEKADLLIIERAFHRLDLKAAERTCACC